MQKKIDIGRMILGNIQFSKSIKNAHKNYSKVEKSIEKRLGSFAYSKDFYFPNKNISFIESYKRNFFTFLMLSMIENLGIKRERLIKYGEVIFCLRTIITSTDNIIDNESKGIVFLKNIDNSVVNNTLLLMTVQNILTDILMELGDKDGKAMMFILNKIHSIAQSESLRDAGLYKEYPHGDFVREKMHGGIGGELLQLSLWAPTMLEKDLDLIGDYNTALYDIGMALQALDDLCDMKEDYDTDKINLGIAKLNSMYNIDIKNDFDSFDKEEFKEKYSEFYGDYVDECIETALRGFSKLESLGYPIKEKESLVLLKYLFELRGIKELWEKSKYIG